MSIFTDRLKRRIADLGLTNAEVARRADLDPRRFGHYVTGLREPDFQTFLKICRVLQVEPNALLGQATPAGPGGSRAALLASIAGACDQLSDDALELILAQISAVVEIGRRPRRARARARNT